MKTQKKSRKSLIAMGSLLGLLAGNAIPQLFSYLGLISGNDRILELATQLSFIGFCAGAIISIQVSSYRLTQELQHDLLEVVKTTSMEIREEVGNRLDSLRAIMPVPSAYLKVKAGPHRKLFGHFADKVTQGELSKLKAMSGSTPAYTLHAPEPMAEFAGRFADVMQNLVDENSEYITLTNASFWSRNGIGGSNHNFLRICTASTENRGVTIKRVFLSPSDEHLKRESRLRRELLEIVKRYNKVTHDYFLANPNSGDSECEEEKIVTRVFQVEDEYDYYSHFQEPSDNFAIWKTDGEEVCLLVNYNKSENPPRLTGITFTPDRGLVELKKAIFWQYFKSQSSVSMDEFEKHLEELGGDEGIAGGDISDISDQSLIGLRQRV